MANILLVEDDNTFVRILEGFLQKHGHTVESRSTVKSALAALDESLYQLLLLDYHLSDGTGLEVLAAAQQKSLHLPAIIMTSFNEVRIAVKAMRSGAFDYITKPVNPDELLMILEDALSKKAAPPAVQKTKSGPDIIEGDSSVSKKFYEYIKLVAPTNMSVLIQGESGTGKEYAASSIHGFSTRANKPFIALDCGALSKELGGSELFGHVKGAFTGAVTDKKGQFEAANGGTLFLDEIGNLSYEVQVKLLRALQEKVIQPVGSLKQISVDVRIIAATNDDLLNSVASGSFREDLYHRLNEFKILVPPLRERGNDLLLFCRHFIERSNQELDRHVLRLSDEVTGIFRNYDWPGNLRELRNVIKRMVLLTAGEEAGVESLPDEMIHSVKHTTISVGSDLKALNEANEKALILKTLQQVKYNKSKAAQKLNIDRKTLYSKMAKYELD